VVEYQEYFCHVSKKNAENTPSESTIFDAYLLIRPHQQHAVKRTRPDVHATHETHGDGRYVNM
jgi:hypothetical protein